MKKISNLDQLAKNFKQKHGRPMTVLHVGNIANNAYNNAALLNASGFDSDVICYDYYHIMACPEWEDAEFDGVELDHNRPNWSIVDLNGYRRPKWFAQGSQRSCIDYLIAKRDNCKREAEKLWRLLCLECKIVKEDKYSTTDLLLNDSQVVSLWRKIKSFLNIALIREDGVERIKKKIRKIISTRTDNSRTMLIIERFSMIMWLMPLLVLRKFISYFSLPVKSNEWHKKRSEYLIEIFESGFLERADKLMKSDISEFEYLIDKWSNLFEKYDLIFAYGTSAILPCICGNKPYVAYEHGTIRDIPFEKTPLGRMTAISYKTADVVYLTNADSIKSATDLKPSSSVFGLHGFNGDHLGNRINKAKTLGKLEFLSRDGMSIFLAPARHHWMEGFATWRKGNDKIIYAVHQLVQRGINDFIVVFVEWGAEVMASKKLIADLGLERKFEWISPLPKAELLRAYFSVNAVIDQFILPCLGSITLEAIAVGYCPVITKLDDSAMAEFYGETIPLLNCSSPEDIAEAMLLVINDRFTASLIAKSSLNWYQRRHSTSVLKEKLYESIVKSKAFIGE